jgi:hypothetical protein
MASLKQYVKKIINFACYQTGAYEKANIYHKIIVIIVLRINAGIPAFLPLKGLPVSFCPYLGYNSILRQFENFVKL